MLIDTWYRSIIVSDLVKLHSCICRCELIDCRVEFTTRVYVYASSVSCQVWCVTSQSQPTRAAQSDGRSTAACLPLPIHSVSQLIVPRHLLSHARLSSCPPGSQRVPWLGRPFMSHDQLFVVLRVSGFLVALLPGFFYVWVCAANYSVSLLMPQILLRAEVRRGADCVASGP